MKNLPYSSAAERNREPILEQLRSLLPARGTVLEIGSGTGQHAVYFCRYLKDIKWQPSDRDENLPGLEACFHAEGNPRIHAPLNLDVNSDTWPGGGFDAAYSANTAHIMSWREVGSMFAGVTSQLKAGAPFCLYGPFNIDGRFTSDSNARFDAGLRLDNPKRGIRDMAAVESLANQFQMDLEKKIAMPANNFVLLIRKWAEK